MALKHVRGPNATVRILSVMSERKPSSNRLKPSSTSVGSGNCEAQGCRCSQIQEPRRCQEHLPTFSPSLESAIL